MKSTAVLLLAIALSMSVSASVATRSVCDTVVVEKECANVATLVVPAPSFVIVEAYSFDVAGVAVVYSAPTGVEVKSVSSDAKPIDVVMEVPVRDTGDTFALVKHNHFSYKNSTPKWLLHCSIRQC